MSTPARRTTVADVAKLAGTSTAVVSYVVNDGPRPVAPETRARVQRAIETLGYRPNRVARAFRSRHRALVGLVLPGTTEPFYAQLGHAVEKAASARKHLTMTGHSGLSSEQEASLVAALVDEDVAGVVVAGVGASDDLRRVLDGTDVPVVFVHHRPEGMSGPLVTVDNAAGARLATTHLLGHGHREVACLTLADERGPVGDRFAGWGDALEAAGLGRPDADDPRLVVRCGVDRRSASEATAAWLAAPDRPRAVFATTDELAIGLLHQAGRQGVRIPEDLAVMAFDGVAEAATTVPELSTVVEPLDLIGERVVDLLLQERTGDHVEVLELGVAYRRSCGC